MKHGTIGWIDLTVDDAIAVRDFYREVVGWQSESVDMGGYSDFNMMSPETGESVAGICHARGSNATLPPYWLIYVVVPDVDESISRCKDLGGEVVLEPRSMGGDRYGVIRDPAGAVCALYQERSKLEQ